MKFDRVLQGICLGIAGFFIGSLSLMGINPFGIGFVNAVCLVGGNCFLAGIGVMLGIGLNYSLIYTIRYGVIILGLGVMLNMRVVKQSYGKVLAMSFVSGMAVSLINLSVYYFLDGILNIEQVFLEGSLVFSATVIFYYGLYIIGTDYVKIAVDSQAALGAVAIASAVLYGMPADAFGVFALAEAAALFGILFVTYKFGFGLGMTWTVIAGTIVSEKNGDNIFITAWLVIALVSYAILNVLRGSRIIYGILFGGIYSLVGILFYDELLNETSLKAFSSALFLFLLLPSKVMLRADDIIKKDELSENSPEWGRLVINRVNSLARAFKRIDYTLASETPSGIGFNEVGEIIEGFANQLDKRVPLRKTIEAKIIEELALRDIQVKNLILVKNSDERYEVYLTARVRRGKLVHNQTIRDILERNMRVKLIAKEESRSIVSHCYEMFCYYERPQFNCITAVRRVSSYDNTICGDNYYIGDIIEGQRLVIIADGMGSGEKAAEDSNTLIETLEELFLAGFDKEMSIRLVNSYLSDRNKGETFSTLDMFLLDLHTGYGRIYKQGAATTFIRRGDWLEMVKSTSLPVGVIDGAVCEKCSKKFFDKDIIIMMSDGVFDSIIFENKEDCMSEILMDIPMDNPEDIADDIIDRVKAIAGNRLRDDATVVVCKVVKAL